MEKSNQVLWSRTLGNQFYENFDKVAATTDSVLIIKIKNPAQCLVNNINALKLKLVDSDDENHELIVRTKKAVNTGHKKKDPIVYNNAQITSDGSIVFRKVTIQVSSHINKCLFTVYLCWGNEASQRMPLVEEFHMGTKSIAPDRTKGRNAKIYKEMAAVTKKAPKFTKAKAPISTVVETPVQQATQIDQEALNQWVQAYIYNFQFATQYLAQHNGQFSVQTNNTLQMVEQEAPVIQNDDLLDICIDDYIQ